MFGTAWLCLIDGIYQSISQQTVETTLGLRLFLTNLNEKRRRFSQKFVHAEESSTDQQVPRLTPGTVVQQTNIDI